MTYFYAPRDVRESKEIEDRKRWRTERDGDSKEQEERKEELGIPMG